MTAVTALLPLLLVSVALIWSIFIYNNLIRARNPTIRKVFAVVLAITAIEMVLSSLGVSI